MKTKLEPCHPRVLKPGCTCYDLEQLQMIAKALQNAGHEIHPFTEQGSRESLWREIDAIMRSEYNTEFDWAWRFLLFFSVAPASSSSSSEKSPSESDMVGDGRGNVEAVKMK